MAQVTMDGREFAVLLKAQSARDELIGMLKAAQTVKFTEESTTRCSIGEFKPMEYPTWLIQVLHQDMVEQLLLKKDEEFDLWVASDKHYYQYRTQEFSHNAWSDYQDLLKLDRRLEDRWNATKKRLEEEAAPKEEEPAVIDVVAVEEEE